MESLILERFNYGMKDIRHPCSGTFGTLELPSSTKLFTVERPWLQNRNNVSCIPTGVYILRKRRSSVVEKSSGGEFLEGWEITDVLGRTYIMFHPANWPNNVKGCVGVGMDYTIMGGKLGVSESRDAHRILMSELTDSSYELHIIDRLTSYP